MNQQKDGLLGGVGLAGLASLAVLTIVGRKSYQRKIVQLSKEMEKEGNSVRMPSKVWAVLTPGETIKVFLVPMAYVVGGSMLVGTACKHWYGLRDWSHGIQTLKWITRTGPPPLH